MEYGFRYSSIHDHNGPFDEDEASVIALHGEGEDRVSSAV